MKIILGLGRLDYGNIAKALLPLLKPKDDSSLTSRLTAAAAKLPAESAAQLLDSLSQQELDGIALALVAEKEEKLLELCKKITEKNGIPLRVSAISLCEDMELSVTLEDIDYAALAHRFLPLIPAAVLEEHPATKALAALMKLPAQLLYSALERLPAEKLESAVIYLVKRYEAPILSKLSSLAGEHGIDFSPTAVRVLR